jgi:enoyl-CoA hydratase
MNQKFETLEVKASEKVWYVTINRPTVLNALNRQVVEELTQVVTAANDAAGLRAVVLQGAGDKAFVAGADIAAMTDFSSAEALEFAQRGQKLTAMMEASDKVFIAKVRGFALGGGCELAMACDIVIAGESARFGQPEVNLGLIAGFGGTQRLVQRVGPALALDMLLTGRGRTLTGTEAFQVGLASRVVLDTELDQTVNGLVDSLNKTGPRAVAVTKRLVRAARETSLQAGLASESQAFALCFATPEAKEGTSAFLGKRSATF